MSIDPSKPRILVTSAAGHTGRPAVEHLLERRFPVRAFVRSDDARAARLRRLGAEVFVGNLFDIRDLRKALKGVRRAYHCPPFGPNLLHGTMAFAVAAEEAQLEAVAWMGAWNRHEAHPSIHSREHWLTAQVQQWMPSVPSIHVDPGLFAFAYFMGLPFVAHFGLLALPMGEGRNAPPSNDDIGRLAAQTLVDPEAHIGRTYRPTGPELVSGEDCAQLIGQVLDRKVRYRASTTNEFVKAALASGYSRFEISQIRHYAEDIRLNAFAVNAPTDHVERVLGKRPDDFAMITRRFLDDPELISKGLRTGSVLGAMRLGLRMLRTRVPDFDAWEQNRGHALIERARYAPQSESWVDERRALPPAAFRTA